MKNRLMKQLPLLFLFLVLGSILSLNPAFAFSGGDGSVGDPYQIANCADLQDIESSPTSHFILTDDIDCSEFGNFSPIPNFSGTLNGFNHTITGISIVNDNGGGNIGLFGHVIGATIENLQFVDFSLINNELNAAYIGAIAGLYDGGTLEHISFENLIVDGNHNGGEGNYLGGVIGIADSVHISEVQIIGNSSVTGDVYMGGLIGIATSDSQPLIIENCAVNATVTGNEFVGGFIGILDSHFGNFHSVSNSYQNGDVITGAFHAGAMFGPEDSFFGGGQSIIQNNFATGSSVGTFSEGGGPNSTYTNNYYTGNCTFECNGNATLSDWYNSTLQPPLDQWDFDTIWMTQADGLPVLRFDSTPPAPVSSLIGEASGSTATMNWTNPLDSDFDSVTIRYSTLSYPASPTEGTLAAANVTISNQSVNSLPDGIYYFSIFSKDTSGNYSEASTVSITIDTTPPTTVISSILPDSNSMPSSPLTITFSEVVTGFSEDDIVVVNGSVTNFMDVSTVNEGIFTFDLIPATSGMVTVNIAEDGATDESGNGNVAAGEFSYTYTKSVDTTGGAASGGGGGGGGGSGAKIIKKLESSGNDSTESDDKKNEKSGIHKAGSNPAKKPFNDIFGHWSYEFVMKLYDLGVFQGRRPGRFFPNSPITNAELLKSGLIAFGYSADVKTPSDFLDLDENAWYVPFVRKAKSEGFISGEYFHPNSGISHQDATSLLLKIAKKTGKTVELPFLNKPHSKTTRGEAAQLILSIMEL